ncbi:MAG: Tol-Pal system beta propeller repeat protein TolB [Nevskiales bacterium]|nr:Tol-Pal system beta propeller repeat protein TolB [Nevskiales bacterium]
MKYKYFILLIIATGAAQASLEITVSGGEVAAQPIAIVPFGRTAADLDFDFSAVISADLARSGQFRPLKPADMLERPVDAAQVDYRNWRALGVDNVVVGQVLRGPNGQRFVRFHLLDVLRGQLRTRYDVPIVDPARVRPVAHQIADMIYEQLTGMAGCFNSQIAYVVVTGALENRRFQIVVADADGFNPVTVATSSEPLLSPVWSPDRQQLAYVGFERGRTAVYVHTLSTGELRKVVAERGLNGAPAWSPDGRALAVTLSYQGNPDIYVIDLASGSRRKITSHFAIDTEAAWSPDGRQIVFTSDRGGQPQIYRVGAEGGEARRVTYEGKQNLRARFSPDGKSLVLVNQSETGYRIGLLNLDTQELRILTDGPLDESPSFAPNGATVIYSQQGTRGATLATVTVDGRIRQRLAQPGGDAREPTWSSIVR